MPCPHRFFFFFFNDPATTEIYPLPLPAALPISALPWPVNPGVQPMTAGYRVAARQALRALPDATYPRLLGRVRNDQRGLRPVQETGRVVLYAYLDTPDDWERRAAAGEPSAARTAARAVIRTAHTTALDLPVSGRPVHV